MASDALGNPLNMTLTPGQTHDITQAEVLLSRQEEQPPTYVIADKAYDADAFLQAARNIGAIPVIPPKKNRTHQRPYDGDIYKERNRPERLFNKLKHFRRIATRYDKYAATFLAFVKLASLFILLK
jgi:transposase